MMAASQNVKSVIPVVDFARWSSNSREEQLIIAKELVSACHNVGFVYIINHGISDELLDEAFDMTKKLFDLSHEEKMLAPHPPGPAHHRGYSYSGLEKVSQVYGKDADTEGMGESLRETTDNKESYEIGSEDNPLQPNIWAPESLLPGFRAFTTSFYWKCNGVAQMLLKALALGLDLEDPDYLISFHTGHENQLRLLHYPPIPAADIESQEFARLPAHSDWGIITLLFQDDCGGLQVEDPHVKGKFDAAPYMKGAMIMNIGDLLMRWSNDYLKSTLHRVTLPPLADRFEGERRMTRARYSIPYFVTAKAEASIQCLPVCTTASNPPRYEAITAGEYLSMRGRLSYRTTNETAAAAG